MDACERVGFMVISLACPLWRFWRLWAMVVSGTQPMKNENELARLCESVDETMLL
jgi:hypothetical protein